MLPHLLAAQHHPQHVCLHHVDQVIIIALSQQGVLVGVAAGIVDPQVDVPQLCPCAREPNEAAAPSVYWNGMFPWEPPGP